MLGYGHMVAAAEQAARELATRTASARSAVNARWAKPLDEELILRLARTTRALGDYRGWRRRRADSAARWRSCCTRMTCTTCRLKIIGLPDKFIEHGAPAILRELYGLSSGHIKEVVRDLLRPGAPSAAYPVNRAAESARYRVLTPGPLSSQGEGAFSRRLRVC